MSALHTRSSIGYAIAAAALCALAGALTWPNRGASQAGGTQDQPLPTRVVIDVDNPEKDLYRVAVPNLLGNAGLGTLGAEVLRNDLRLVSLFAVLDPRSFIANLQQEGLGITKAPWSAAGAQGVVKGQVSGSGGSLSVDMRLYEIARGETPILQKTYRGGEGQLRGFMHDFANEMLRVLTGKPGGFGTRITFARKVGPGRKDVYVADFDGHGQGRVSSGRGLAMLPSFGPGGVWYSVLTQTGMFITNVAKRESPIITGSGLNSGPAICGGRVLFSSTRDGNSEIYSANTDGSGVRRLTNHPAIDVSPACGPGGLVAFVSARHGGPQIFTMNSNGGEPKRVTYKGNHNQVPAWCPDPTRSLLAFSGRDAGGFDVFTLDLKNGQYRRLTQGQGSNTDPAFSPDCRMVMFASTRGGLFISNPEGLNQNKILSGAISTVRWRTRKD
jgi:TolB protein